MSASDDHQLVTLERRSDKVALVSIDHPRYNVLSMAVLDWLRDTLHQLVVDPPGAVVIWGGPRVFSTGADVAELAGGIPPETVSLAFQAVALELASIPRATIAAINGYALGGGLELALACDLRVVAHDARLGQPEVLLGIMPGGGATQRLPRLVGVSRAKDMLLTGRQVRAEEALRIGLADRVSAADSVLDDAIELARELARGALVAQGLIKRAVDRGIEGTLEHGLGLERREFASVFNTADARSGISSFLEQGPGRARFRGL